MQSPPSENGKDQDVTPPLAQEEPVAKTEGLEAEIVRVLRTVYDPEIPVDIYELGLIYKVDIQDGGAVDIQMTLTTPACPAAGTLPPEVEAKVRNVQGVRSTTLEVVWDPPWEPSMMSEAARLTLGM